MVRWSAFTDEELERRRLESVEAMKVMAKSEFEVWYQERCDADYWTFGRRCSGCDHWASNEGYLGECHHGGLVSGLDVLHSLDMRNYTGPIPDPGYPMTRAWNACSNFKDEFDWSTLPPEYLTKIGAMKDGLLRNKPQHIDPHAKDTTP